jgi:hypothetical protein
MQVRFESTLPSDGAWLEELPALPSDDDACRTIGDEFLLSGRALALRVPSVIVPKSRNVILNPRHPVIDHVTVESIDTFAYDRRLLDQG